MLPTLVHVLPIQVLVLRYASSTTVLVPPSIMYMYTLLLLKGKHALKRQLL